MTECVYVMIDPYHDYAAAMMRFAFERYGLRAVCLLSSRRDELYGRQFVKIDPQYIASSYYLEEASEEAIVAAITASYQPIAVIPHDEPIVERAAALLAKLPIAWNPPAILQLFRNKHALKQHLRVKDPTLPLNHTRYVTGAADAIAARCEFPGAIVLKPNDGMGTRQVALIPAGAPDAAIGAYFAGAEGRGVIMEEFIEAAAAGVEYAVNGQIDAAGGIVFQSIISYLKISANGRSFISYQDHHVPYGSDTFKILAAYATRVMTASGLRRCPFHMELILSQRGPLLVEVAARLPGAALANVINDVHGSGFDVFAMAMHYYLFDRPYEGPGPHWANYNANKFVRLFGIYECDTLVASVEGVAAVEQLPSFRRWRVKPKIGEKMLRTVDLFTRGYDVHLISSEPMDKLLAVADQVRSLIKVNRRVTIWQQLVARGHFIASRLAWRCRFLAARLSSLFGQISLG